MRGRSTAGPASARRCALCAALLGCIGCAAETAEPATPAVPYAVVQQILEQSCAKQVCHGFMVANGGLDLMQGDPRAVLVNVPACEYDRMMRVDPGDPEHSWIMVKLTGPVRFRQYANFIDFVPDADWHATMPACAGEFDDGSPWFGGRMPPPDTTTITAAEIDQLAAWIRAGARAD